MSRSLGIVVPAYRPPVRRLITYIEALDRVVDPSVIRVELDAPRTETLEALVSLPVDVETVPTRQGKGRAISRGFDALDTDVRCFVDADGSVSAASVGRVVEPVVADETDLAVGSRRHPEARVTSHQTVLRRLLGDGFAWLARRCIDPPLSDYQCGAKALDEETWETVREHLHEPGFAWDTELIAVTNALGRRIEEVPVEWHDYPVSTVRTAAAVRTLARGLLVARYRTGSLRSDSPSHGRSRFEDTSGSDD